jgi:hypothetical protein
MFASRMVGFILSLRYYYSIHNGVFATIVFTLLVAPC